MASTMVLFSRDEERQGLAAAQAALVEGPGVSPDTLFVVPGDEIPVDHDAGFLKCARNSKLFSVNAMAHNASFYCL